MLKKRQAYIAISLDTTGALRSLAFYIAQRGGKSQSGPGLHFQLYAFFFFFATIVGNDPVILRSVKLPELFVAEVFAAGRLSWLTSLE